MFRTSYIYLQEDYTVRAALYGMFSLRFCKQSTWLQYLLETFSICFYRRRTYCILQCQKISRNHSFYSFNISLWELKNQNHSEWRLFFTYAIVAATRYVCLRHKHNYSMFITRVISCTPSNCFKLQSRKRHSSSVPFVLPVGNSRRHILNNTYKHHQQRYGN
jgi:hypothetical protein